jgi:hypothetical protein
MRKSVVAASISGLVLLAAPAYAQWIPGSEIVGQSIQVDTNGVVNTISFDPGGVARISSPGGMVVQGTWTAANNQLCLQTATGQECWPYQSAFQAGQPVTLVSSCQSSSRWTALSTNQAPGGGERG